MIERKIARTDLREYQIHQFIGSTLKNVGHSHTKVVKTPLGDKVVIFTARPGLIVGKKGENIKKLTNTLKKKFNLENPQIEIAEVPQPELNSQIVSEKIASNLERFGIKKFKAIIHRSMQDAINAGAFGIEIVISGKVPSSRARSWRFFSGFMKKSGDIALEQIVPAYANALLKSGIIGIRVRIMRPDIELPDDLEIAKGVEAKEEPKEEKKPRKKRESKKEEKSESKEEAPKEAEPKTEAEEVKK